MYMCKRIWKLFYFVENISKNGEPLNFANRSVSNIASIYYYISRKMAAISLSLAILLGITILMLGNNCFSKVSQL